MKEEGKEGRKVEERINKKMWQLRKKEGKKNRKKEK